MRLCDFCWGGFANVEFAKFASWKCSTWPLDLRLHPEKKKGNIPIPSIYLPYIYHKKQSNASKYTIHGWEGIVSPKVSGTKNSGTK